MKTALLQLFAIVAIVASFEGAKITGRGYLCGAAGAALAFVLLLAAQP